MHIRMEKKTAVLTGAFVLCFILFCLFSIMTIVSLSQMRSTYDTRAEILKTMTSEFNTLTEEDEQASSVIQADLTSATASGQDVAVLQTEYNKISSTTPEGLAKMRDNMSKLSVYSAETDKLRPWCITRFVPSSWSFVSTFSFVGDTLPVLWVCTSTKTDIKNQPLAYTTGVYDRKTNSFSGIQTHITDLGLSYVDDESMSVVF